MTEKVLNLISLGDFKVPSSLFLNYKELNLNDEELIVLIYLLNEKGSFNPKKISTDLKIDVNKVLLIVDKLCSNEFISLDFNKITKEENINFELLYKKLAYFITSSKIEEEKTNIYDIFEKEFSRTLSPTEYELISGWIQGGFKEEIIELALKEAVYNGAMSLRYIDKILYEWKRKNIQTKEDVEKDKEKFQNSKREVRPKKELLDYDWLDEDK